MHTSTSEVYGTARAIPIDESHPLRAQSPYAASKIGADKLAEAFHYSFGLPVVTVRPFNTYGPRQSARAIVPTIVSQCLSEEVVRLGNVQPIRDLTFVDDTVQGFLLAAKTASAIGQTINLGTGRGIRIGDLAELIMRIVGRSIPMECETQRVRPEQSEVDRLVADSTLAKTVLGWHPTVSLEDGLERTVHWMRQELSHYRSHAYSI